MIPQCPHCSATFDIWAHAKRHVKFCPAGRTARLLASELTCYFCGTEHFQNFAALGDHVRYDCIDNPKRRERPQGAHGEEMNVGQYIQGTGTGDYLPLLDAKLFKSLEKKGRVTAKMIACRQINSPKFQGLAMDFKNGVQKFSFLARFDRWDITALVKQLKSDETDDWVGETVSFVAKKSSKGQTFVNVELPKRKGK